MDSRWLRLDQLDRSFKKLRHVKVRPAPKDGWIRTIRIALGLTIEQLAMRLGTSAPAVFNAERREVAGTISLAQLRKIAAAMECDLIYALIPRRELRDMVEQQAQKIARNDVERVAHSMALEGQQTDPRGRPKRIEALKEELLNSPWSRLWS